MNDKLEALAILFDCNYCGAKFGEWCQVKNGGRAKWLHAWRSEPIRQAYAMGHSQGYTDCQAFTTQKLESIQ